MTKISNGTEKATVKEMVEASAPVIKAMVDRGLIAQAKEEIAYEEFRLAVEEHKVKLREKKSVWDRLIPWKIVRKTDV